MKTRKFHFNLGERRKDRKTEREETCKINIGIVKRREEDGFVAKL
jgi:hypothetical protein